MKKILFVDMDNVLVNFASGIECIPKDVERSYAGRLDEVPGIFALMDPMPGAIESFTELAGLFDTYVLSTAPWKNPSAWSDKLLWVNRHLGALAHKRLILSHHKDLCMGHFLIDDRTKNGSERFAGEHILFGSTQFPNWAAVTSYLRERAT